MLTLLKTLVVPKGEYDCIIWMVISQNLVEEELLKGYHHIHLQNCYAACTKPRT